MKTHPYVALAAHLEELRASRPAVGKQWTTVAPLCLATIGVALPASEKHLLRLEKAFLMVKDSCSGMDDVWVAWIEKHDPWKRRPEEEGMENHGWELASVFASAPNAAVLKALLASASAPSAQEMETGLHARHCLAQRDDSKPLAGADWAVPLNLLGCLVSYSAWSTTSSEGKTANPRILDAVDVLLAHGVNLNAPVTADGRRALGLANHPDLVQGLLSRGADPFVLDNRGVPSLATFWEGPSLLGDGRAQAMTAFWKDQAIVAWELEAWKAWFGKALERVADTTSKPVSSVYGWTPHQKVLRSLFEQGLALGGEFEVFVRQQGPLLARRLLVSSHQSKTPVPEALAPLLWWPVPSSPVPEAHWLLMAQAFSLPPDGTSLSPVLSRRAQEDLAGTASRREAVGAMVEQLTKPPTSAMEMAQAWCQAATLQQTLGRDTFFSKLWNKLAAVSLDFCQHAPAEDLAEALRCWFKPATKGIQSTLATEFKKNMASGAVSQWPLESVFLLTTLVGTKEDRQLCLDALTKSLPDLASEQRLEGIGRLDPKAWTSVGLKESLSQRHLAMRLVEQPTVPRPRF